MEDCLASGHAEKFVDDHIGDSPVVEVDGEVAGYSAVRGSLLELILIDERRHRSGLETALLAAAEERLGRNHAEWRLESIAENEAANRLSERHRWTERGRVEDGDTGAEMIVYGKRRP